MHHPRVDIRHLYIKREDGGKGLIKLELANKTIAVGRKKYLDKTTEWMIQLVNRHEKQKKKCPIKKKVINYLIK